MLEEYGATWDVACNRRSRDAVCCRDGWRCMTPACTCRRGLEVHHIVYRSRGGSEELSNKILLCAWCHRFGEHGNFLCVRGKAPDQIFWRLGRPEIGVWYHNELRLLGPPEGFEDALELVAS
jgi:HNH endonuclease